MNTTGIPQKPTFAVRGFWHDENLRLVPSKSHRILNPPPITDKVDKVITDCVYSVFPVDALVGDDEIINTVSAKKPIYSSSDKSVVTVDKNGLAKHVSAGPVTITIDSGKYGKIPKELFATERYGTLAPVFRRLVDGCLVNAVSETIDEAIEGRAIDSINIFAYQNHASKTYVRNPHCWAAQWHQQLSCVSPWNNELGVRLSGTLITPRHLVQCAHYSLSVDDIIRFVTPDNVVVERKIIGTKAHPDYSGQPLHKWDLMVLTLDSDVPNSIIPASVIRGGHQQYIGADSIANGKHMPCIVFDQEEHAIIADSKYRPDIFVQCGAPIDPLRHIFYEPVIFGDSSDPILTIVDNVACLLTVTTFVDTRGSDIGKTVDILNDMIRDADKQAKITPTGYTCNEKDMSAYQIYNH